MRVPRCPMGRGSVPDDGTLVRSSAAALCRHVAARPAGQYSRPMQMMCADLRQVTNLGAAAAVVAGSVQVNGHDLLPRGAQGPWRVRAPGSLTGDCPDARNRAERQRIR
jgi:hypothetical protein